MGMVWIGRRLSTSELQAVLDNPTEVTELLFGNLNDEAAETPKPVVDLDKAWHGIHYLLTGAAWSLGDGPAGEAILGGEQIGGDQGYGPVRLLRPEAVGRVAAALRGVSIEELRSRFDPDAMTAAEIYPDMWTRDDFDEYLARYFTELRDFYAEAAANGQAALIAIV